MSCPVAGISTGSINTHSVIFSLLRTKFYHFHVLSGNLTGDTTEGPIPVIIKFSDEESLLEEVSFYNQTPTLHGHFIPGYYGLFFGWYITFEIRSPESTTFSPVINVVPCSSVQLTQLSHDCEGPRRNGLALSCISTVVISNKYLTQLKLSGTISSLTSTHMARINTPAPDANQYYTLNDPAIGSLIDSGVRAD